MKKIYVVILFLVFLSIINVMFISMNIFPESEFSDEGFSVNSSDEPQAAESIFDELSDGISWSNVFNIFFGKVDSLGSIAITLVLLGGAVLAAYLTHSPAPFVLLFMSNVLKNIYVEAQPVLDNYPINSYILILGMVGFIILFIITAAEYLTHGDA